MSSYISHTYIYITQEMGEIDKSVIMYISSTPIIMEKYNFHALVKWHPYIYTNMHCVEPYNYSLTSHTHDDMHTHTLITCTHTH